MKSGCAAVLALWVGLTFAVAQSISGGPSGSGPSVPGGSLSGSGTRVVPGIAPGSIPGRGPDGALVLPKGLSGIAKSSAEALLSKFSTADLKSTAMRLRSDGWLAEGAQDIQRLTTAPEVFALFSDKGREALAELEVLLPPRLGGRGGVLVKPIRPGDWIGAGGSKLPSILNDVRQLIATRQQGIEALNVRLGNGGPPDALQRDQKELDAMVASLARLTRTERVVEDGVTPKVGLSGADIEKAREAIADALERNPDLRVPYYRPCVVTRLSCGKEWEFGNYDGLPIDWRVVCTPTDRLREAVQAVGRVSALSSSGGNVVRKDIGTGFLVAPDVILTNWHVVADGEAPIVDPAQRQAKKPRLRDEAMPEIEFGAEACPDCLSVKSRLLEVLFIHPELDAAFVRIQEMPDLKPLVLERASFDAAKVPRVAVVGFPMQCNDQDSEQCRNYFSGQPPFGLKRISPGQIVASANQGLELVEAGLVRHDCTTLHGNSGSPLIDLETGRVIALHFREDPIDAYEQRIGNFAVRLSALASDPHLKELNLPLNWAE